MVDILILLDIVLLMTKKNRIKTIIVGLGKIGMGYDYYHNSKKYILSHAQAIYSSNNYELVCGVDKDPKKIFLFKNKFNVEAFININQALKKYKVDLVIISTPTKTHATMINLLIEKSNIKYILCEKPLSYNYDQIKSILNEIKRKRIKIFVNYYRYFEPNSIKLANLINSNKLGKFLRISVWYSKGLYNNCSHFINYLSLFMGKVINIKIISKGNINKRLDPEPDFVITYENGIAYFLSTSEKIFFHNHMQIIGTKGMVHYINGGDKIEYWKFQNSKKLIGNKTLVSYSTKISKEMNFYQYYVYKEVKKIIHKENFKKYNFESALKTLSILDKIKKLL